MIFDSHAHYDDEKFDPDREELLSLLQKNNIARVINVGANLQSTKNSIQLAKQYDFIYAAVGVHPSDVGELDEEKLLALSKLAEEKKVCAIGEIGLDYNWDKEEMARENQKYWFRRQLDLALEKNLPVIIHSRDAAADTMEILKNFPKREKNGVIHCYSYSPEMAKEYIKMGYYVGIGGVVTFKNGKKCKETVSQIPLERILLETDCPYMAPEPNRGTRNSSLYLPYVVEEIARLKGISAKEVEEVTYENARELFHIDF